MTDKKEEEEYIKLTPVKGQIGLFRRSDTGAILNIRYSEEFMPVFGAMIKNAGHDVDRRLDVDLVLRTMAHRPRRISDAVDPSQTELIRALNVYQLETDERIERLEMDFDALSERLYELEPETEKDDDDEGGEGGEGGEGDEDA